MKWILPIVLALQATGCSDQIIVPNLPPVATFDSLVANGPDIDVFYGLEDEEGDDVSVSISICAATSCFTPTPAAGGDGLRNLPTRPGEAVLHLFRWSVADDIPEGELGVERTLEITPRDERSGAVVRSEPFRLSELGF
jgi:hypothetical protein